MVSHMLMITLTINIFTCMIIKNWYFKIDESNNVLVYANVYFYLLLKKLTVSHMPMHNIDD
jgi:hypothetical protein